MLRYRVLQLSPTSLPQITLEGQVKQQCHKGSQWTNLESQLQKQAPGDPLIFDEIQQKSIYACLHHGQNIKKWTQLNWLWSFV